ncbi:PQ loop repeat-domain-containing protein [Dactylonectria estremocensis]|uniref:PQ loop repeat-domain-containing protein n=1 Tax=Dactylonectria estremocensis TaxID=1079267 RepID=A0A9P9F550_9HYPO|nr:PQ loop repeat-domain-containing protein [Dactylonectria estremocensis]
MAAQGFLPFLSAVFGWIYFLAWSISFYPQGLLNWSRRSTSGTTVDFHFINILGFLAYFISNVAFYYSSEVRAQYAARNHGLSPTVQFNDITFAFHGIVLSLVVSSQYLLYPLWGFDVSPNNRPSRFILGVAAGCITGVAFTYLLVASSPGNDALVDWVALDIVYAIGYVKLIVTLIKYMPQMILNYRNKSTEGWSIVQILLDLTGGILSVTQQGIDSYLQHDWSGITGNPAKFALGQISMIYNAIFITQHYVLYRDAAPRRNPENERLLGDEERRID